MKQIHQQSHLFFHKPFLKKYSPNQSCFSIYTRKHVTIRFSLKGATQSYIEEDLHIRDSLGESSELSVKCHRSIGGVAKWNFLRLEITRTVSN